MTREKVLPLLVGAVPVVAVLLLVVFISATSSRAGAQAWSLSKPPSGAVSISGTSAQSPASRTGEQPSGQPAPQGGPTRSASILCFPLLGCI